MCDVAMVKNTTSLGKVKGSSGKLAFPQGTVMFLGRRSLSFLGEKLQPFCPHGMIMPLGKKELMLP
jgi:hypothetical protein